METIKYSPQEYKIVVSLLPFQPYLFIKSLSKTAFDSVIPLEAIYRKGEKKIRDQPQDLCIRVFTIALFLAAESLEAAQMSASDWLKKLWYALYDELLCSH